MLREDVCAGFIISSLSVVCLCTSLVLLDFRFLFTRVPFSLVPALHPLDRACPPSRSSFPDRALGSRRCRFAQPNLSDLSPLAHHLLSASSAAQAEASHQPPTPRYHTLFSRWMSTTAAVAGAYTPPYATAALAASGGISFASVASATATATSQSSYSESESLVSSAPFEQSPPSELSATCPTPFPGA